MTPSIFISAGEASGEHYGALLVEELKSLLRAQGSEAHFWGMGGERMAAAGLERVVRSEDMAVMGITEVVRHLPRIYREFRKLKQAIRTRRPSVAILIDFPDIHFKLARELHKLGIPVVFFVSPQIWAWKQYRIKLVRRYVDRMLVIFPFEEQFYRERFVHSEFVGHPLAALPLPAISRADFAAENGLDPTKQWIALLPGSRPKEIRNNLREILIAAQQLGAGQAQTSYEFLLPLAPTLNEQQRGEIRHFVEAHAAGTTIRLVEEAGAALFHARASIVASGTATVEAALIGNPFVVVYRVSPLTYAIAKRVVKVPHVAMANLIAGKRIVPELIQNDFRASNIVRQLLPLLPDGPPRQSMMKELAELRGLLRPNALSGSQQERGAIGRVADVALELSGIASGVAATVPSKAPANQRRQG